MTEGGSKEAPPTDHAPKTHPVFGVQQTASLLESRERGRAKEFFLDQLAVVEEKQRRTREKVLRTLQQESDMLKTTKEGYVVRVRVNPQIHNRNSVGYSEIDRNILMWLYLKKEPLSYKLKYIP